jgi:protein-tyrosine-phosphatase
VHPEVVEAMNEIGIDLSDRSPTALTRELAEQADIVITMGCGDQCPVIPGKQYVDWGLQDPAGQPTARVRTIRDEIRVRVGELIEQLDQHRPPSK